MDDQDSKGRDSQALKRLGELLLTVFGHTEKFRAVREYWRTEAAHLRSGWVLFSVLGLAVSFVTWWTTATVMEWTHQSATRKLVEERTAAETKYNQIVAAWGLLLESKGIDVTNSPNQLNLNQLIVLSSNLLTTISDSQPSYIAYINSTQHELTNNFLVRVPPSGQVQVMIFNTGQSTIEDLEATLFVPSNFAGVFLNGWSPRLGAMFRDNLMVSNTIYFSIEANSKLDFRERFDFPPVVFTNVTKRYFDAQDLKEWDINTNVLAGRVVPYAPAFLKVRARSRTTFFRLWLDFSQAE